MESQTLHESETNCDAYGAQILVVLVFAVQIIPMVLAVLVFILGIVFGL